MSRPLLQLALDHTHLQAAQHDVALLQDHVDIVEAGTILCLAEGLRAVTALRAQCPDKIIVADWKVADAGETLAQQAFNAGANWMTIICAAPLATVEKGHAVAQACGGEIQMELFGNWTLEDAATSMGATPIQVFFKITIPLARPGIMAGALLAFLYSFDEVALSSLLSTPRFITLPIRIMNYMELTFDPTLAAISTLLILASLVLIVLMEKFVGLDMFVK